MITGDLRNRIDKLWEEFWTGGITNPLTVIEQITFLMFARLLDMVESHNERKAKLSGASFKTLFPADGDGQKIRWSHFKNVGAEDMLPLVRDRVFPHFRQVSLEGASFAEYMKDAQLMIQKPNLLVSAVNMIDALPLGSTDVKGDLYEYLLSKLTTAGINGQFRTPRHIIRFMVEMLEPKPTEVVGDPACGTGGFLVGVMEYLVRTWTSPEGVLVDNSTGEKTYSGDLLEPYRQHIRTGLFHGFDFDTTMLRIASMNLLLHGVDAPDIHYQDALSGNFTERFPTQAEGGFDVILANPPFKGSLDEDDVHKSLLAKVKTKKTELLFVALILRMLKLGGRSATIVPDGVLFGSNKAHQALRKLLVDSNQLEAVISLPSGVFRPYAGVSTGILVFTKGGRTDGVFFFDVQADGFSLDDKRNPVSENDLPLAVSSWQKRNPKRDTDRRSKAFFVPADEIRENKYDLSVNRYKETVHPEQNFESPLVVLERMKNATSENPGGHGGTRGDVAMSATVISTPRTYASLGEVAEFINGYAFKPQHWGDTGRPIIRIQNLTDPTKPFNRTHAVVPEKFQVKSGDLLVSWSATLGVFEWSGEEALLNQHIFKVVPRTGKVHPSYLRFVISQALRAMQRYQHGSTMEHVNRGEFLSTQIPLPPLCEQERIANILGKAAQIRTGTTALKGESKTMLMSLFLDFFGEPNVNPRMWPVHKLATTLMRRPQIGTIVPATAGGEDPVVRVGELGGTSIQYERCARVTLSDSERERFALREGDFLLARAIGSEDHLGKASIAPKLTSAAVFDSHVMRLRFNRERIHPLFFYYWLRTPGGRALFMRKAGRTSVQFNINSTQIEAMDIPLPPLKKQDEFVTVATNLQRTQDRLTKQLALCDLVEGVVRHSAL